jgi:hypothetical protein
MKKSIAKANAGTINRTIPADPSNQVQKIVDRFAAPPPPPAPIATRADGTIAIPAASFTAKNASAPVSVMTSADAGSQLLSTGCKSPVGPPCFHPESSSWSYDVTAATAGTYYLTSNFSTYHMNTDLWVSVNDAKAVEMGVYYTVGYWNETQSTEVTLTKGKNTLIFTRTDNRDVMYKDFFLYRLWNRSMMIGPPPALTELTWISPHMHAFREPPSDSCAGPGTPRNRTCLHRPPTTPRRRRRRLPRPTTTSRWLLTPPVKNKASTRSASRTVATPASHWASSPRAPGPAPTPQGAS